LLSGTREKLAREGMGEAVRHGIRQVTRSCVTRVVIPVSQRFYDWRLGLPSDASAETEQSAAKGSEYVKYEPTPHLSFRQAMKHVRVRRDRDVFIDIGSGRGRVLIMAARYPFRRIIGLEVSAELNACARENIARVKSKLECSDIEIIDADAASFDVPDEVTVAFLFNPFTGRLLSRVCENLHRSLVRSPRELKIIFANPVYFEREIAGCDWLTKTAEFSHRHRWGIYESRV
jgi:SAM-dependent methyltransferase